MSASRRRQSGQHNTDYGCHSGQPTALEAARTSFADIPAIFTLHSQYLTEMGEKSLFTFYWLFGVVPLPCNSNGRQ